MSVSWAFVTFVVSWEEEITAMAQRSLRDAEEEGFFGSFGGIEEFLTTRITKEHKDGHVFLVFVVCVCFVVEQGL